MPGLFPRISLGPRPLGHWPRHAERNKCQVPDVGGTQVSLIQLGTRAPGFGGQPNIRNGQFRGAGVCGTRALIPNLSLGGQ